MSDRKHTMEDTIKEVRAVEEQQAHERRLKEFLDTLRSMNSSSLTSFIRMLIESDPEIGKKAIETMRVFQEKEKYLI